MSEGEAGSKPATPVVDVLDTDEAKLLLESGRAAGQLRAEDIARALDELELGAEQLDEFYTALDELQIEVVEREEELDDAPDLDEGGEISTDTLQLFLKDIGRVPLLTAAQEVELAKRIERGDHSAKQAMVEANLRLVVSTYATWWIRQAVARALADKARTIRMPVHVVEKLNKIVRTERTLRARLGREPSSAEIGLELDLAAEEVDQIRRSAQTPVSLEKPVGDEEESEFGHFLTDESAPLPDEAAETALRKEALRRILGTLSHRERRVLELRYGLDGEQPRTLDEVGKTFNVTRERIRQIENQSLKKLRALADAAKLRDVAA